MNDILDSLETLADGGRVSIQQVLARFGKRGYGAVLVLIPLIDISPVGAIPGLPTAMALVVALVGIELAIGRDHLWLPGFVGRRTVSGDRLAGAARKLRGLGRWMDRWFHGRLTPLTRGPFARIAGVAVLLLCCMVPPLELVPLATTIPMAAIAAFGLALLAGDGLLMIAAMAMAGAAGTIGLGWALGG